MKRILSFLLALLICSSVCLALASCTGNEETLVLGFDAEYPPFGYAADGEEGFAGSDGMNYVGFDIEFAEKVTKNLGYKLVLTPIDWDSKDALMESGAIDMIWNGFTYEGREDEYEWTDCYFSNSIVILTSASSGITTLAGLAGKTVCAQSDSSAEDALKKKTDLAASFKNGTYSLEAAYTTAFEKLKTGAIDAIAVDIGVANYLVANNAGYVILDEAIAAENYAVGFKKGNTALASKINKELNKVAKDTDFVKQLCEKYGLSYDAFLLGK